jgi:hypothetical protein
VPHKGGTSQQAYDPTSKGLCLDLSRTVFRESGVGSPIPDGNDNYQITTDDPCLKNGIVITLHRKHP